MEDQGKRLLLAVAIAFGLLWLWSVLFPSKPPQKKPEADQAAEVQKKAEADETPASDHSKPPEIVADKPEEVVSFENAKVALELSTHGAAIKSWRLLEPQLEDRTKSPPIPLELVPTASSGAAYYPLQIVLGDEALASMQTASWTIDKRSDDGVSFRWSDGDVELFKHYKFDLEHFYVELTIDIVKKGEGESKQSLSVLTYAYQDLDVDVGGGMTRMPREWKSACLIGDDVKTRSAKDLKKKPTRRDGNVRWGGFAHSYFVAIMAPEHEGGDLKCDSYGLEGMAGGMRVELTFPEVVLDKGDIYQRRLYGYFGPKRMSNLQAASNLAAKSSDIDFNPTFEEVVDLGWLGFLSGPLLWLLTIFQSFVINWGVAIILLTVVVKLLVLPWTHKSIKSMKAMSKLRPQMEKLKDKYADDKQRQQVEMMNLFKSHGVNPLAGCLPMLLQMPIWFALYRMLMAAAELYQAPFVPGYINDLTAPDPYYILPILVTGLMYFQTKLTPTTATGMQQKLLMYGMPLMFGVFSIWFPAGLTLYIFTNTCLTLVHHFFVHREDRQRMAAEKRTGKSVVDAAVIDESDDDDSDEESMSGSKSSKSSESKSGKGKSGKGKSSKGKSSKGKSTSSASSDTSSNKSKSGGQKSRGKNRGKNRGKKGNKKGGRK